MYILFKVRTFSNHLGLSVGSQCSLRLRAVVCIRVPFTAVCYGTTTSVITRSHTFPFKLGLLKLPNFEHNVYRKSLISRGLATMYEEGKPSQHNSVLRLEDYDCIGFDLDNTLCEYNILPSVELEYKVLANFLVNKKGYDPYLLKALDAGSIDFLQKGLIIDFDRGNLLKISANGIIQKASHGTKFLTDNEIISIYGKEKKWEVTTDFCKNVLVGWEGPHADKMRSLLDYFDMPASLAFARIVDSLDQNGGRPSSVYNVWADVKEGIHNMYNRDNFQLDSGGYFQEYKCNPKKYVKTCKPEVLKWLQNLKKSKIVFLITGSHCDFASLTAETCLGENWKNLFDIVICYARKPGFFTGCRPFVKLNGFNETDIINGEDLDFGKVYSQGNWQELYQLFSKKLNKKEPKCLYFGDNLIQDIYTPSEYTRCDTVAVVEELAVESSATTSGDSKRHPSEVVLLSNYWGSYFYNEREHLHTLWSGIIRNYSKICIPSLSYLACNPIDYEYSTFSNSQSNGYFPKGPAVTLLHNKANK